MASRFQIIEELKNQTVLQREKLLQTLDLKYSYHVYHLLQQRYLIQQHIQKRYDLLIKYINSLHINEIDNINETDNTNDILLQRILGLIKSLDTDQPLPENKLNGDHVPILGDIQQLKNGLEPQLPHDQPKRELNTTVTTDHISDDEQCHIASVMAMSASQSSPVEQSHHPESNPKSKHKCKKSKSKSQPTSKRKKSKSKTKHKKKHKRKKSKENEWKNTELSSLLAPDIRRLLLNRGAIKKDLNGVKKCRLIKLLKKKHTVSLPRPFREFKLNALESELKLRGIWLRHYVPKRTESIIKILNGETITGQYAPKRYKPGRLDTVCAACLEKCNSTQTTKCTRCFREYHTSCIEKGKICKLCLDKNAGRRSKRLQNKTRDYTEIIPKPTCLRGIRLAPRTENDAEYVLLLKKKFEQRAPDLEYPSPPPPPPEQLSGHKRMLHDHDVTSHQIKRVKLNTNRSIPALTKDYGMDDSKIADVAYDNNPDPSLSLRKQATLREAVHKLVHGTRKFSQLPIKCKAIIGIALMNEIVRG
eukprot:795672_1